MGTAIVIVFFVGYALIILEHPLKINKTATAIITGIVCWTLFMFSTPTAALSNSERYLTFNSTLQLELGNADFSQLSPADIFRHFATHELGHHLTAIAEILFFLLGAMTIVELIDAHHGFRFITDKIKTRNPKKLLWIICWISFFLSAILDNLTTTIVMISLIRKLIADKDTRLLFIGMIVISANAGGAWTPMGDVTTTMLWIGGQVSTFNIIKTLFIPSVVCMITPLMYLTFTLKEQPNTIALHQHTVPDDKTINGGKLMLLLGIGILMSVPLFKVVTHMPPYTGMLLGLGLLWVVSEWIHPELDEAIRKNYTAAGALARIDVPGILFFLGILLAVGALESLLILENFAAHLNEAISSQSVVITFTGILSAVIDNVPLVAASMAMYSLDTYPTDHFVWEYLAYCAGTGGSILIIGSAAGIAAMGMEKIDFIWYVKRISLLALAGYLAGAAVYLLMN